MVTRLFSHKPAHGATVGPCLSRSCARCAGVRVHGHTSMRVRVRTPGRVCREWRAKKMASRRQAEEDDRKDRQRRGVLTGREIFLQSQTAIVDDDTAAADTDMMREIDEEQEIARMQALSLEAQRKARVEVRLPLPPLPPPSPFSSGGGGGLQSRFDRGTLRLMHASLR